MARHCRVAINTEHLLRTARPGPPEDRPAAPSEIAGPAFCPGLLVQSESDCNDKSCYCRSQLAISLSPKADPIARLIGRARRGPAHLVCLSWSAARWRTSPSARVPCSHLLTTCGPCHARCVCDGRYDLVLRPGLPLGHQVPVPSATVAASAAGPWLCRCSFKLSTSPPKRSPGRLDPWVAMAHAIHACEFCNPTRSRSPCDPASEILSPLLCPKPCIPTAGEAFVLCYLFGHNRL